MAECKECLYYEVCADFRRNICVTDQKRFEEYKINSNGICDRFEGKSEFQKIVRCKDCEHYSLAMLKCCFPLDDKHSFDNYVPPIWQPNDFCSYGTPKERGGEK